MQLQCLGKIAVYSTSRFYLVALTPNFWEIEINNITYFYLVVLAVAGDTSFTGVGSGTTNVPCGTKESWKFINCCRPGNQLDLSGTMCLFLFISPFQAVETGTLGSFHQAAPVFLHNWYSAQCSRCQLGCSGSQNCPCISGSCYRSILSEIRV